MVQLHIVEQVELRFTELSCVPSSLRTGVVPATTRFFANRVELVEAIMAAFTSMLAVADAADRHLLVLSCHGVPLTGTTLVAGNGDEVDLTELALLFEIRPSTLVVLVSACWGGYSSVTDAIQARDRTPPPLVVGPLAQVAREVLVMDVHESYKAARAGKLQGAFKLGKHWYVSLPAMIAGMRGSE